ncbi:acetyl xylan esterase AXE1 [Mucilaginibacter gracilis]|uniref:Acetyl xylan esterase AXE1 n=1 Tax=Mucilaginibacter gracilis TaxID=423350 RepID=A0A495J9N8_9SPHI|nr:alpha/beta hydrolase family protein [Mucilaginibacter gracilis]RKR85198.1 acetyl xylan esterase AXE1 [Mucilaginibacter gracilis]
MKSKIEDLNRVYSFCILLLVFCFFTPVVFGQTEQYPSPAKVAADFYKILDRPKVAAQPQFEVIITDSVIIEKGSIYSEQDEKIPIIIYKPLGHARKAFPTVICLHGTSGNKQDKDIKNMLYQITKKGMMAVAIDARYHGDRIPGGDHGSKEYVAAAIKAWQNTNPAKQTHPFLWDTVYDLWRLTDYLVTRPDVKANRIGMTGISMGGIETWMAASVDSRIKVAVLDIAAQSFKWSLDNDKWQGRTSTIQAAHLQAAKDMGDSVLNQRNVKAVWDKLLPGITGEFDCPSMIRLFAPRPLLVLSNELDANCPLPGAKIAYQSAQVAYGAKSNRLEMNIALNQPHRPTPEHMKMLVDWFAKWL